MVQHMQMYSAKPCARKERSVITKYHLCSCHLLILEYAGGNSIVSGSLSTLGVGSDGPASSCSMMVTVLVGRNATLLFLEPADPGGVAGPSRLIVGGIAVHAERAGFDAWRCLFREQECLGPIDGGYTIITWPVGFVGQVIVVFAATITASGDEEDGNDENYQYADNDACCLW